MTGASGHNQGVTGTDKSLVLDREQLRSVTLDDEELMREIVTALIDDTAQQMHSLEAALREADGPKAARLAHYSKGACANVGANAAAALLTNIEQTALRGDLDSSRTSLAELAGAIDRLRSESVSL
jgi:HPt (histidine-containing phosphotransfer) domain-containing protein